MWDVNCIRIYFGIANKTSTPITELVLTDTPYNFTDWMYWCSYVFDTLIKCDWEILTLAENFAFMSFVNVNTLQMMVFGQ